MQISQEILLFIQAYFPIRVTEVLDVERSGDIRNYF